MKKNIVFITLIIALIVATSITVYDRMQVEKTAETLEITLAYTDFAEMADQSEHSLEWWFEYLKDAGVASVALEEESIYSMIDAGVSMDYTVLENIKSDTLWEMRYPESFVDYIVRGNYDPYDVVVVTEDQEAVNFILEGLSAYNGLTRTFVEGDKTAILLDGRKADLRYSSAVPELDAQGRVARTHQTVVGSEVLAYGIGYDVTKVQNILDSGLQAHLRPMNNARYPEEALDAYMAALEQFNIEPSLLIFSGTEVVGYPSEIKRLNDWMSDRQIAPVLIETGLQRTNADQKGLLALVENASYQAVRTLPITEYIQERYAAFGYKGGEEIENTIFRAAVERNIRLIYFRPYLKAKDMYITTPEAYQDSFVRLDDRLARHHITLGDYSLLDFNDESLMMGLVIGLGLTSIIILISRFFFNFKTWFEYFVLIMGGVCVAAALYISPNLGRQLIALTGALLISSLGAILMLEFAKERYTDKQVFKTRVILLRAILFTSLFVLLATFGGMIVGALLSHSKYLLKIQYYRGVKISEVLPLAVFIVLYFLKFGYDRNTEELRNQDLFPKDMIRIMNVQIKVSYIVLATFAAAVLYIYVARSGHDTSITVSNLEIMMRNFLELKLPARPRTKEFMIAVPAMMCFVYSVYKGYKAGIVVMGLPAMITFTSIINTFSHSRAPLYMSFYRTGIAAVFGIIIGALIIIVYELAERLIKRLLKSRLRYAHDETKELGA